MKQYITLIKDILTNGKGRSDRTNTGTISIFGYQMRFNLEEGFPLVTTKKVYLRSIIEELIWFLNGDTSNVSLEKKDVKIWSEWALKQDTGDCKRGDLGPIYGKQWRDWSHNEADTPTELTLAQRLTLIFDEPPKVLLSQTKLEYIRSIHNRPRAISEDIPELEDYLHALLTKWRVPGGDRKKVVYDQIATLITNLKKNPYSRRHIVSAWNVPYLPDETVSPQANVLLGKQALPPCHTLFQFYVEDLRFDEIRNYITDKTILREFKTQCASTWATCGSSLEKIGDNYNAYPENYERLMLAWCNANGVKTKRLSCQLYQRSGDSCLGIPFNIASYSLLLMMVAQVTDMVAGDFIHTIGDAHIYKNHIEKAKEQMKRKPFSLPRVSLNPEVKDIFSFKLNDFILEDYESHPKIDFVIAV